MTDDTTGPKGSKPWSRPPEPKGPVEHLTELKDLVVAYARQETIDPLKTLGRYLGFGTAGALLIGIGWVFALMALLRGLQDIDIFDSAGSQGGTWIWAPYLIVAVVGIAVAALYGRMVAKRMQEQESRMEPHDHGSSTDRTQNGDRK